VCHANKLSRLAIGSAFNASSTIPNLDLLANQEAIVRFQSMIPGKAIDL
jgi:hypothetical protein